MSYVSEKVEAWWRSHGGRPGLEGPLKEWAEARFAERQAGDEYAKTRVCVVGEDGQIQATGTNYSHAIWGRRRGTYIDMGDDGDLVILGRARGQLEQRHGVRNVVATFWDLCSGQSERARRRELAALKR